MSLWMAFDVDDHVARTLHLTARQHGAYMLLVCAAWKNGGRLPGDGAALRAIARLSPRDWRSDRPALEALLVRRDGGWVHEGVERSWRTAHALIEARREAGLNGARRRWHGHGAATAPPAAGPAPVPAASHWPDDAQEHRQEPIQREAPPGLPSESGERASPVAARPSLGGSAPGAVPLPSLDGAPPPSFDGGARRLPGNPLRRMPS